MDTSREFKRKVAYVVVFLLLCVAVGAGWGALSDKAFGSVPVQRSVVSGEETQAGEARCCPRLARKYARQFRSGRIHHASGFRPGRVFHAPRRARRVIVNKTHRYLRSHPGHLRSLPAPAGLRSGCDTSERCYAYRLYAEMREDASCVSRGVPSNRAHACIRPPESKLTKEQIQKLGGLVLCGGSVAFGVATSPFSAGTTAFVAMWGAAACGWSFWMSFD